MSQPVIIAVHSLSGGGAERVAVQLANHWPNDATYPVLLVTKSQGPYRSQLTNGIPLIDLETPTNVRNFIKFSIRARAVLKTIRPIGVISHLTPMSRALLRMKALGMLSVPLIAVEHSNLKPHPFGHTNSSPARWLLRQEIRLLYYLATKIVGVSTGVSKSLGQELGVPPNRVCVIPNPIDIAEIKYKVLASPHEDFANRFDELKRPVILAVGRLHALKGFDTLIKAYSLLSPGHRGSLVILGEGPERLQLMTLIQKLGLETEIYLPGFVSNPWWFMARSNLFVSASRHEGFGLVIAEAIACEVPVVATDCDYGPSEILANGLYGTLVEVDNVEALSEAMRTGLSTPGTTEDKRQAANSLARFAISTIAKQYAALINNAIRDPVQ